MYKYVLKYPFRQDIFKQTYQNVVFKRLYILTLYTVQCTYASLNACGIKLMKLIIVGNISNLFKIFFEEYSQDIFIHNVSIFCTLRKMNNEHGIQVCWSLL